MESSVKNALTRATSRKSGVGFGVIIGVEYMGVFHVSTFILHLHLAGGFDSRKRFKQKRHCIRWSERLIYSVIKEEGKRWIVAQGFLM